MSKQVEKKRRKFAREFKSEAVKIVESGRSVEDVAQGLGIGSNLIYRWRRAMRDGGEAAFPGHGKLIGEAEEIRKLKRELADVKAERDILKKAMP